VHLIAKLKFLVLSSTKIQKITDLYSSAAHIDSRACSYMTTLPGAKTFMGKRWSESKLDFSTGVYLVTEWKTTSIRQIADNYVSNLASKAT
jgi:hypothetical protein